MTSSSDFFDFTVLLLSNLVTDFTGVKLPTLHPDLQFWCKSTKCVIRLNLFLSFHANEVLINSFITSNSNYCRLTCMFSSFYSVKKLEVCKNKLCVYCMIILMLRTKSYLQKGESPQKM